MSDDDLQKNTEQRSDGSQPIRHGGRARPHSRRSVGSRWFSTEAAAQKLDIEPPALRQRVRRCSRSEDGQIVARLGTGVVARKFGTTWRFFFGEEDVARDG